jgi:hypothetical protein
VENSIGLWDPFSPQFNFQEVTFPDNCFNQAITLIDPGRGVFGCSMSVIAIFHQQTRISTVLQIVSSSLPTMRQK